MTSPSTEQEREAFETWAKTLGGKLSLAKMRGGYVYADTACAWRAWTARSALPPTAVRDEAAEAGLRKLAEFGAWCYGEFRSELGDIDGGSAQDAMERLGLLVKFKATEQCGESCRCVEYGDFPNDCYRASPDIVAFVAIAKDT